MTFPYLNSFQFSPQSYLLSFSNFLKILMSLIASLNRDICRSALTYSGWTFSGEFLGMRRAKELLLLPKIYHIYTTIMKPDIVIPYLKKVQKIYKSPDTTFTFSLENNNFFISRNTDID